MLCFIIQTYFLVSGFYLKMIDTLGCALEFSGEFFRRLISEIYPLWRTNIIIVIHISDSESLVFGSGIRIFRRCSVELPWEIVPQNVAVWIVFTYILLYKAQHRTKSLKVWLGSPEYHLLSIPSINYW